MSSPGKFRDEGATAAAGPHSSRNKSTRSLNDFDGYVYVGIEGLAAKFLENRPWSAPATEIIQKMSELHGLEGGSPEGFAVWLEHLHAVTRPYNKPEDTAAHFTWLKEMPRKSSLALFKHADGKGGTRWSDVLALGEMSFDGLYRTGLNDLCEHANEVFTHQPSRVLLHGFHVCGGMLEMWVFDRSGLYGSKAVDITKAPHLLVQALASYVLMDDASLGVGDLIKNDHVGKYIECVQDGPGGERRLYLDEPTIFARVDKTIVGDGLTCYRAKVSGSEDWGYAVKIKWSEPSHNSEAGLLKLAMEKRVWGVIQLIQYETVCRTSDWRDRLVIGAPRRFRSVSNMVGHINSRSAADHTTEVPVSEMPHADDAGPTAVRVLSCIVLAPLGESLHRFTSVPGLLYALRDAIRGHRSLYLDGGILHQDVCPGNIIIPSHGVGSCGSHEADGVLIDLDVAKLVTAPWRQFESVGTQPFQAIGVLQAYLPDNPHTYRHDLESFFYTFLFLAICKRPVPIGENQLQLPKTSKLRIWTEGRPVDKAKRKTEDMQVENFRSIMAEFTPEFKGLYGLAENLRGLLFPMRGGKLWTGTDHTAQATAALYDGMVKAFDQAAHFACSM